MGALKSNGRLYIVALLACGWPNNKSYKWSDTRKLMEYGMEEYELRQLSEVAVERSDFSKVRIAYGQTDEIGEAAGVAVTIVETMDRTNSGEILMKEGEKIKIQYQLEKEMPAPVHAGDRAGYVNYYVDDTVYRSEELVIEQEVLKIDLTWCLKKIFTGMIL